MQISGRTRVKICCISSVEEAHIAVAAGADALGLVSTMPSGPGVIAEDAIAAIAAMIPPGVASFLLTSAQDAATIIEQQRRCRVNTLQLVDDLKHGTYADLRTALPSIKLVQVIHVTGPAALAQALAIAPEVDALLLDSGNPTLAVKELGGTGRVHDWATSRRIRGLRASRYTSRAACTRETWPRRLGASARSESIYAVACAAMGFSTKPNLPILCARFGRQTSVDRNWPKSV